jgi:hypothetical protein
MTARLFSEGQVRSRAWLLHAEFAVADHPLLADIQNDKIYPEYVRECFRARDPYLNKHMKELKLLSFSVLTALSSLCNREVMPVVGILYDTRVLCENTVQGIFHGVDGLNARRGVLHFGTGTGLLQLHAHPAFIQFLGESSLGGMNRALMWRVDCRGFSDASQATIRALEVKDRTLTFAAVIDVEHRSDLIINSSGDIASDYFEMNILRSTGKWD